MDPILIQLILDYVDAAIDDAFERHAECNDFGWTQERAEKVRRQIHDRIASCK